MKLRDYQRDGVEGIRAAYTAGFRAPLYVLPTGGGKCLGRGTSVLMFSGDIKMVEDVVPGDLLMGPDSRPRRVVTTCRGIEPLYRVVPTKGMPYVVNESHILSLRKTAQKQGGFPSQRGGAVVNISVRKWLGQSRTFQHIHKGWRAGVDFQPMPLPYGLPPYFLGLWLGDGTSRNSDVTTVDPEVVDALGEVAVRYGLRLVKKHYKGRAPGYALSVEHTRTGRGHRNNPIRRALDDLGLLGSKHVPHAYKCNTEDVRREVLAGLIDSDGSPHHGGYDLVFSSKRLADDTAFIARSLGLAAYVGECRKTCGNNGKVGTYHRVSISGDCSRIPVQVKRKIVPKRQQKKNVLNVGIKVEPLGEGDYYGFEIDGPDRLFLLGDFTVTHNTVLFCHIADGAAQKGKQVFILVHRRELLEQTSKKLTENGVPHGIIAPDFAPAMKRHVQVASVQTLVQRLNGWRPDMLIVDEAHHAVAGSWQKIIAANPQARILGVTATPERLDGKGLKGIFDTLVNGPTMRWLIDHGFLADMRVLQPPHRVDLKEIKKRGSDYDRGQLEAALDKATITGDAVEHYAKHVRGAPAIAFCVTVAHAEHVAERFRQAGFRAVAVDGTVEKHERRQRIRGLEDGSVQVLTSCELVSEGLDVPGCQAAILLRPTKSLTLYLQQVGRALRPKPDGSPAIILDHAGNSLPAPMGGHGHPADEREWTLDEGFVKSKKGRAGTKTCPECLSIYRVGPPACPSCGYAAPVRDPLPKEVQGELVEHGVTTPLGVEDIRDVPVREAIKRCKTLEALQALGKALGKEPQWATIHYEQKRRWAIYKQSGGRIPLGAVEV